MDIHGLHNPQLANRRQFLADCGVGLGKIAAASLLAQRPALSAAAAPRPRAKAVIHLFMGGAPRAGAAAGFILLTGMPPP